MWKMSRIGAPALSPDAENLLYQITSYNMSENRGVTQLCVMNLSSGETKTLTDTSSNNHSAVWLGNDRIAFLSNRDGSSAVWTIGIDRPAKISRASASRPTAPVRGMSCARMWPTVCRKTYMTIWASPRRAYTTI